MFDVFISHSSRDRIVADALKHALEVKSIRTWKAPENILPGQIWEEAITEAISQCIVTLLVWSAESQSSVQVKRELTLAASLGKVIIPFRIEDIAPEGSFAYYLTNTHWLDAFSKDQEDAFSEAVDRVKRILPAVVLPSSGQHEADIRAGSGHEVMIEARSHHRRVLRNILPSLDLVSNQVACQALLREAFHEGCATLPNTLQSLGYLVVQKRSKKACQYTIHFCDTGIIITTSGDLPFILGIEGEQSICIEGSDIKAGSALLKTKGLRRRALEELCRALKCWTSWHVVSSFESMVFFDRYKGCFSSVLSDDFYPFCSGGIAETEITFSLEVGPPLVSFVLEQKTDSGGERFAGATFYRDNIILCADDMDGDKIEWEIISVDQAALGESDNQKRIMTAVSDMMSAADTGKVTFRILEEMILEWRHLSRKMPSNLTECHWSD